MCSLRMTSPFRIVIIATRHISSPFHAAASLRDAFPLPTNTLLYFPLADQRPAYLWPVQAQHRYGAARLLFANHRLDFSFLFFASPSLSIASQCIACAVLRQDVSTLCFASANLLLASPSLIFATLALANPHNTLLMRFYASLRFTSCKAGQRLAIASPIDATRCLSTTFLCYAFPSPCNPKHYLACAFPLFPFGSLGCTILLRGLASTCRSHSVLFTVMPLLFRIDIVPDE